MGNENNSGREPAVFNESAISILQGVFSNSEKQAPVNKLSKTTSLKFMITMRDEENLRKLGYSQPEIDRLTPQEAEQILKADRA